MPEKLNSSALIRTLFTTGVGIACAVLVVVLIGSIVFDRMQLRGDALRRSKTLGIVRLHVHTQANFVDAPSSDIVRSRVLPMYDEMEAEILAFEPLDDADTEWKASMLEFLNVMIDGWEMMADAIDQGNIVIEDQAHERFEAAIRILNANGWEHPLPWPEQYDHVVMVLFLAADRRIETGYNERIAGSLPAAELADILDTEVLPAWTAARERLLLAADDSPAEYQQSMFQLTEYAELRTQAYVFQVEALRGSNAEKSMQAMAMIEQSRQIRESVVADGLRE